MIILLADELFASGNEDLPLLSLLHLGYERRHSLQTDPGYEPEADREVNRWLARQSERVREEVLITLKAGLKTDAHGVPAESVVRIVCREQPDWGANPPDLPLAMALPLLRRPLRLLVEDAPNDGAFLQTVAPNLWRRRLQEALEKKWVEIGHGGGLSRMRSVAESVRHEDILQLWLLFDSDAREPGQPSRQSEELRHACLRAGIPHHQLLRRASENYLPVKALQAWAESSSGNLRTLRRRKANAFASMSPDHRHHYGMKHGFQKDRQEGISAFYGAFADHADLQDGFGRDIASLYRQEHFPIREEWLEKDGQYSETLAMVQSILRRL